MGRFGIAVAIGILILGLVQLQSAKVDFLPEFMPPSVQMQVQVQAEALGLRAGVEHQAARSAGSCHRGPDASGTVGDASACRVTVGRWMWDYRASGFAAQVAAAPAAHGGFAPSARTLQRHFAAAGLNRARP
ncbi:MAG: hypothetical protein WCG47_00370 [Dermatophilaceae bacterium]